MFYTSTSGNPCINKANMCIVHTENNEDCSFFFKLSQKYCLQTPLNCKKAINSPLNINLSKGLQFAGCCVHANDHLWSAIGHTRGQKDELSYCFAVVCFHPEFFLLKIASSKGCDLNILQLIEFDSANVFSANGLQKPNGLWNYDLTPSLYSPVSLSLVVICQYGRSSSPSGLYEKFTRPSH